MPGRRVLLVDDHAVVVQGVKGLLADEDGFEVVGEAYDGEAAIEKCRELQPDLVIMDVSMPRMNGIQATAEIRKFAPNTCIVIYTMYSNIEYVLKLFKAGISAYVLKGGPTSDLIMALNTVRSGGTYFSTSASELLSRHLSEAEEEKEAGRDLACLSRHLADGESIRAIADKLFISPKTVETHKYNILEKLNLGSVTDLTKLAIRNNLIQV